MATMSAADKQGTPATVLGNVKRQEHSVSLTVELGSGEVLPFRIEFLTDFMVRIRANPAGRFDLTLPERDGLLKADWGGAGFELVETDAQLSLVGRRVVVRIGRAAFSFSFHLGDAFLTSSSPAGGVALKDGRLTLTMDSPADERFLGLGYQGARYVYPFSPDWAPLDHRGHSIQMTGLTSHRSYHVPFFQSSRGYGFFLNALVKTDWDLAKTDKQRYSIAIDEDRLDLYLIAGPRFTEILERYTELVGRPPLPPKWEMGAIEDAKLRSSGRRPPAAAPAVPAQGLDEKAVEDKARAAGGVDPYVGLNVRWFEQQELEERAREIRREHISCDAFHLDSAWQTIRGSFEWVSQIPDPEGLLRTLNELHFKPRLWQRATIEYGTYALYKEAEQEGYLVTGPDGTPFRGAMNDEKKVLFDFTNPEAVKWWNAKTARLVKMGARAFKLDSESGGYSEALPEARHVRFSNGMTGAEMENYHGALYVKAVFDGMREALGGKRVAMHVFYPTYFASGRYPICCLGDRRHRCTQEVRVRIALNMGLSGAPMWQGTDYTPFGLPHADPAFNIRLMPYTYSLWRAAHESGMPIVRAMVLDYQDDPESFRADTQLLYGDAFLVAPTIPGSKDWRQVTPPLTEVRGMKEEWEKGKDWRLIYFPKGEWVNFWTKEKYTGPEWRYVRILTDQQPTFVRGGAIVSFGPTMEYVGEKPADPLTLELYPCGTLSFTLYEDDGETYGYESGEYAKTEIRCTEHEQGVDVEIGPAAGSYAGMLPRRDYLFRMFGTVCPESVVAGEAMLDRLESENELQRHAAGWCYRKDTAYSRQVLVKLSGVATAEGVKLRFAGAHPTKYYF